MINDSMNGPTMEAYAVVAVEYGDSVDGKGRVAAVCGKRVEARNTMREMAERYKEELVLDFIEILDDSASVGSRDECGCEYLVQEILVPVG